MIQHGEQMIGPWVMNRIHAIGARKLFRSDVRTPRGHRVDFRAVLSKTQSLNRDRRPEQDTGSEFRCQLGSSTLLRNEFRAPTASLRMKRVLPEIIFQLTGRPTRCGSQTNYPQRASARCSGANYPAIWRFILSIALVLLYATLAHAQNAALLSQPTPSRAPASDTIRGKLRRFDSTPHVAVPVQLLDRSNQVVQTQLSDDAGGYSFTNVPPGTYRVRCHVLGGVRYHGLDRVMH